MKKLILLVLLTLNSALFAVEPVSITWVKGSATIVSSPNYLYEYISRGFAITDESTVLSNIHTNNYSPFLDTVEATAATYTATSATITSKAALSTVSNYLKIGSIIKTKHTPAAWGIVKSFNKDTINVGHWYNNTTTAAITPSPTTGTGFYINEWVGTTNELLLGKTSGQTIYGGTSASGTLTLGSTTNTTKGTIILSDFTSLGTGNTAIKVKKLTTTTAITTGGAASVVHGLTGAKILAVTSKVAHIENGGIAPGAINTAYLYDLSHDATNVTVTLGSAATSITGKAITILVTYEE